MKEGMGVFGGGGGCCLCERVWKMFYKKNCCKTMYNFYKCVFLVS